MRVTGVELTSDNTNVFSFGLGDISSSEKYLVKTIIGLDADEIIQRFYAFGQQSAPKYYNFGLKSREIVMRVVLNPNYAINEDYSDIRDELYRTIAANRTGLIDLLFTNNGAALAFISGYIKKFEVPYFSKIPELQITIVCDDPMLRGFSPIVLDSTDLGTASPLEIADAISTAPHGFTLKATFTAASSTFTIQSDATDPEWLFKIEPVGGFAIGDELYISSVNNDKQVYYDRSASIYPLMDVLDTASLWPIIFPGMNEFHIPEIADVTLDELTFYPMYWGI